VGPSPSPSQDLLDWASPVANVHFYDLPVYRLAEVAYNAASDKSVADFVENTFRNTDRSSERVQKAIKQLTTNMKQHDYDKFGPWRFNEIIGYVRLHFLGSQVRGEYFAVSKKKVVLTRKKTLIYQTHKLAPELTIPRDATNEQILNVILEYVDRCRKEEPRRHFDDALLRKIGPFVDWNAVMRSGWGPA
jgi:hypothetical protein